ncbi:MAG: hypothetical protein HFH86_02680 [Bacilli bacterium]|nr:hypothetical protein [Bacilli bacterium]
MKKVVIKIIFLAIVCFAIMPNIDALSKIDTKLSSNIIELKEGNTVELTLAFDNFEEIKKGVNAYKGTLEYDKNIFEEIVQSDFACQNNWEELKYNPQTNEIVAIRKVGTLVGENVVKVTLKVKKNVEAAKTIVKIKNLTTSEGKKDIYLNDAQIELNILKEQETIPTKPTIPSSPNPDSEVNKPSIPNNNGSNTNNPTNPKDDNEDNDETTTNPEKPEEPNDKNDENNNQNNNVNNSEKPKEEQEDKEVKITKTAAIYKWLLIFILIQLIIVIIIYYRRKKSPNNNKNTFLMLMGIIITEFIGTSCVFAYNFALKGELNGDSEINYADASLLELHLVNLFNLDEDKLGNADMNGDGKITITDLSLLIQKLENNLDYEVTIAHIEPENFYPNKNQDLTIKLNADVSFGASIKSIMINKMEYEVFRNPNTKDYTFIINVGLEYGIKKYNITSIKLDNNKEIKIQESFEVDVLKDIPTIQNYRVEENIDESKLTIVFDLVDDNNSLESGYLEVYRDEQKEEIKEKLTIGENRIEIPVEELVEYKAYIVLNYNLSNHEEDVSHKGVQHYEKDLQLVIDYNLSIFNIKTYKEDQETTEFDKEDQVKIVFESSNNTKHVPDKIKVADKEYEVSSENNKFIVLLDALTDLGSKTITIDEIILSNGKKFELKENNSITINVNRRKPKIKDLETTEMTETDSLKVMFHLDDPDVTVKDISLIVLDENDQELDRIKMARNEVKEDGTVNKFLKTKMTSQYKVKVLMSYNLTDQDDNCVTDELAAEKIVKADPRVNIKNITLNSNYVSKGGLIKLTYELESNKKEDITRILVNNINCIAVKLDNGNYEITLNASNNSGIYSLTTTRLTYSDDTTATTDKTIQVEILKEKPQIINFVQLDNINTNEVTLRFDVLDQENSFLNGKAILTYNDQIIEKDIVKGHNELTFQVEPRKKYILKLNATYDLDSNTLEGTPNEDNRIVDETLTTKEIELIADYELKIGNIKTYNDKGETKYFGKSEPITISFESSNVTTFEPVKAVVNGVEYPLTKKDNAYFLTISSERTSGLKTATIEKITLSNTKELMLTENNKIQVTVLKDKPTVEQFGYKENMDATITSSFKVIDEEEAITDGKVMILKNGTIVKEQNLEKNENSINFKPEENQNYIVKVIANYDLDMNILEEDANEYKNVTLLEAEITLGHRKFELKDIIRTSIYKQTENGVEEVSTLRESDLTNLNNYIAKVFMKQMPTFYTKITGYRIEANELKLTLDFNNVVQYNLDNKQDKLEVVFGTMNNGVAKNITLEGLIREMEANPTGTFTLTRDYDASIITKNSNSLISSFNGTLNGNGHKIYNLSKPLFETLESATIENLILENPKLSGVNSRGTLANAANNTTVRNVHVKDLTLITGTSRVGGLLGETTATTIEQSSVNNFKITTSLHIRVGGLVGNMIGGSIKNCYVEGELNSTQNKDGNGISGILGTGDGKELITIENCIAKVVYANNVSARLNGDIIGLALENNTVLKNNVSLSTGNNFYSIHGSTVHSSSINNYELKDSGLVSNAAPNRVTSVSKEEFSADFFKNNANFDETIWDFSNASYDHPPVLQVTKTTEEVNETDSPSNNKLYIPDYSRIKKINGYTNEKDILYHNINKLMPYYDAKYLIEDGLKIQNDNILNTKIIKHILPFSNGKLLTYLTSQNENAITAIKVVFDDNTIQDYEVTFNEAKQNIAMYTINGLDLEYAFHNYSIKESATIVETIKNYINSVDYATTLDPLTASGDSRLYRDHYNEKMKPLAEIIALQLLQNDGNSILNLDNEILNNKIKQELIDSGRLNKILYAYNYYHRWYHFEIGGAKVSDILLFEGKMYKDSMTIDNLTEEVLTGNLGTNATHTFFANSLSKYTGSSALTYYLDGVIKNIGGYEDINDWFTEHFSSIGILSEIPVENHPEVKYRAWDRLKGFPNFILPLSTLPKYAGYIVSGPAQFQVGAQRVYIADPTTPSGQNTVRNHVKNHSALIKRQFDTMAGSFHVESWNSFTIMVYDTVKTITGYKTSYFPGTNIPIGTTPITTQNRAGSTTEPFHKNFNEAVGAWQYGSAAGVGNTAGFLWFIARPGLTNYDTWTHEFEHALYDKIMLFRKGARLQLETYTEGNVQQNETWSNNNISGFDVGPYYFNFGFTLGKESMATQNLTPERINTREKLENYFKGQFDALELLDYVSAKAFIQLTPEEQAKIATRMNTSAGWSTWGTITKEQAEAMNLTTLESLYDNRIMLRPNNAWGVSVRGLVPINSIGANDYGYESIWVTRWYMGHYDNGYADAFSNKKNMFEMLGYAGVDGYVTFGSKMSSSDLDAIQKITLAKTGKAMNWKEYRMSRYAEIESKKDNKYVNIDLMIEQFVNALRSDAKNGNRNITGGTNLRKIYYHYLKRVTNDFIDDPLGTNLEMTHIKTAEELVNKINAKPYGYYILDNDIDFSGMTKNITQTFMGKLDGNGHKIIGNKIPIFQKIRFGYVKDLILERTNIPMNIANVGALSVRTEYSVIESVKAKELQLNFGGRNDLSLIGGAVGTTLSDSIEVDTLKNKITSKEDFLKINENPGGIFVLESDIDFTGYTGNGSVITNTFTGKLNGNGHTISNLNNLSLFNSITGSIENLNIHNFTNIGSVTSDDITAFAKLTNGATLKNLKFENITLEGRHRVSVVASFDNANSTFENISVKNANVKGSGVYVSTFIGRKYGGVVRNVFVEGTLEITTTENGGIIGAFQKGGTLENVISKVNIHKTGNTYTPVEKSEFNGGIIGNIYDNPVIKNSLALGNMKGFTNANGEEKIPFKVTGAADANITATMDNCYEYAKSQGSSSINDVTANKIKEATEAQVHTAAFYKETLHFDESIWNLDIVSSKGYPELK